MADELPATMIRFPTFQETPTCQKRPTAQDSLRQILTKFPPEKQGNNSKRGPSPLSSRTTSSARSSMSSVESKEIKAQSKQSSVTISTYKLKYRYFQLQSAFGKPITSGRPFTTTSNLTMPSSKGEPDNPELREKVKEEVKQMSKGGGPGSWSAWKAGELARRYEAQGGGYIDKGDHKNKSQKGAPEPKDPKDKKESAAEAAHRKKEEREDKKEEDRGGASKDEGKTSSSKKGGSKKK